MNNRRHKMLSFALLLAALLFLAGRLFVEDGALKAWATLIGGVLLVLGVVALVVLGRPRSNVGANTQGRRQF